MSSCSLKQPHSSAQLETEAVSPQPQPELVGQHLSMPVSTTENATAAVVAPTVLDHDRLLFPSSNNVDGDLKSSKTMKPGKSNSSSGGGGGGRGFLRSKRNSELLQANASQDSSNNDNTNTVTNTTTTNAAITPISQKFGNASPVLKSSRRSGTTIGASGSPGPRHGNNPNNNGNSNSDVSPAPRLDEIITTTTTTNNNKNGRNSSVYVDEDVSVAGSEYYSPVITNIPNITSNFSPKDIKIQKRNTSRSVATNGTTATTKTTAAASKSGGGTSRKHRRYLRKSTSSLGSTHSDQNNNNSGSGNANDESNSREAVPGSLPGGFNSGRVLDDDTQQRMVQAHIKLHKERISSLVDGATSAISGMLGGVLRSVSISNVPGFNSIKNISHSASHSNSNNQSPRLSPHHHHRHHKHNHGSDSEVDKDIHTGEDEDYDQEVEPGVATATAESNESPTPDPNVGNPEQTRPVTPPPRGSSVVPRLLRFPSNIYNSGSNSNNAANSGTLASSPAATNPKGGDHPSNSTDVAASGGSGVKGGGDISRTSIDNPNKNHLHGHHHHHHQHHHQSSSPSMASGGGGGDDQVFAEDPISRHVSKRTGKKFSQRSEERRRFQRRVSRAPQMIPSSTSTTPAGPNAASPVANNNSSSNAAASSAAGSGSAAMLGPILSRSNTQLSKKDAVSQSHHGHSDVDVIGGSSSGAVSKGHSVIVKTPTMSESIREGTSASTTTGAGEHAEGLSDAATSKAGSIATTTQPESKSWLSSFSYLSSIVTRAAAASVGSGSSAAAAAASPSKDNDKINRDHPSSSHLVNNSSSFTSNANNNSAAITGSGGVASNSSAGPVIKMVGDGNYRITDRRGSKNKIYTNDPDLVVDLGHAETPDEVLRAASGEPGNDGLLRRKHLKDFTVSLSTSSTNNASNAGQKQQLKQNVGKSPSLLRHPNKSSNFEDDNNNSDVEACGPETTTGAAGDDAEHDEDHDESNLALQSHLRDISTTSNLLSEFDLLRMQSLKASQTPVEPWRFVHTRAKGVKRRVLWRLFLAQELSTGSYDNLGLALADSLNHSRQHQNSVSSGTSGVPGGMSKVATLTDGTGDLAIKKGSTVRVTSNPGRSTNKRPGSISSITDLPHDLSADPSSSAGWLGGRPGGRVFTSMVTQHPKPLAKLRGERRNQQHPQAPLITNPPPTCTNSGFDTPLYSSGVVAGMPSSNADEPNYYINALSTGGSLQPPGTGFSTLMNTSKNAISSGARHSIPVSQSGTVPQASAGAGGSAAARSRKRNISYAGNVPATNSQDHGIGFDVNSIMGCNAQQLCNSPSRLSMASTTSIGTSNINPATANSVRGGGSAGRQAGAIWNIQFSKCGRYFAAGGQDGIVRIWRLKAFAIEECKKQLEKEQQKQQQLQQQQRQRAHTLADAQIQSPGDQNSPGLVSNTYPVKNSASDGNTAYQCTTTTIASPSFQANDQKLKEKGGTVGNKFFNRNSGNKRSHRRAISQFVGGKFDHGPHDVDDASSSATKIPQESKTPDMGSASKHAGTFMVNSGGHSSYNGSNNNTTTRNGSPSTPTKSKNSGVSTPASGRFQIASRLLNGGRRRESDNITTRPESPLKGQDHNFSDLFANGGGNLPNINGNASNESLKQTTTPADNDHRQQSSNRPNLTKQNTFATMPGTNATSGNSSLYHQEEIDRLAGLYDQLNSNIFPAYELFEPTPYRVYVGHTGDVLSLSWSKNNFLLTASMDRTVRLWHPKRSECLCVFRHKDIVPSIAFHPRDDRYFISGSLDCRLRLWDIPSRKVRVWTEVPDQQLITSVGFTSYLGDQIVVGTYRGMCVFYKTKGLEIQKRFHARSSRGHNAKGSKITGFAYLPVSKPSTSSNSRLSDTSSTTAGISLDKDQQQLLVSSNDSRLRMYSLKERMLQRKYKGHVNASSQSHATFSSDGQYMITGSEDHNIYVWSVAQDNAATVATHPSCDHIRAKKQSRTSHGIEALTQPFSKLFNSRNKNRAPRQDKERHQTSSENVTLPEHIATKDLKEDVDAEVQENDTPAAKNRKGAASNTNPDPSSKQQQGALADDQWESLEGKVVEKSIYEYFPAHDANVSTAIFVPVATLRYLAKHGDPILSRQKYRRWNNETGEVENLLPGDKTGTYHGNGTQQLKNQGGNADDNGSDEWNDDVEDYTAIIVSADYHGQIRVFRKDINAPKNTVPAQQPHAPSFCPMSKAHPSIVSSANAGIMYEAAQSDEKAADAVVVPTDGAENGNGNSVGASLKDLHQADKKSLQSADQDDVISAGKSNHDAASSTSTLPIHPQQQSAISNTGKPDGDGHGAAGAIDTATNASPEKKEPTRSFTRRFFDRVNRKGKNRKSSTLSLKDSDAKEQDQVDQSSSAKDGKKLSTTAPNTPTVGNIQQSSSHDPLPEPPKARVITSKPCPHCQATDFTAFPILSGDYNKPRSNNSSGNDNGDSQHQIRTYLLVCQRCKRAQDMSTTTQIDT
ncbi:hypothetical protein H4219_003631 [Mycoemilia scoparia]|uniref:WD repeat-containing protein 44 n=1 Tax=Mycoemilia scoparia TaxID=417184 RepID=A0A9W8DSD7_9FUNG|nr:hypothetical protein H4219_003631 [Mycoemilia scoparia]